MVIQKAKIVSRSSTEAEYMTVTNAVLELCWLVLLLRELQISLPTSPFVYCDIIGATNLCSKAVYHSKIKSMYPLIITLFVACCPLVKYEFLMFPIKINWLVLSQSYSPDSSLSSYRPRLVLFNDHTNLEGA